MHTITGRLIDLLFRVTPGRTTVLAYLVTDAGSITPDALVVCWSTQLQNLDELSIGLNDQLDPPLHSVTSDSPWRREGHKDSPLALLVPGMCR